ncbi:MBL fold metallo-hydrolase [Marinibaculum pumilum]|uniref:MBL fold metallo-hydrolase n=1 Tax=Marinibaculum pumilum TaxID=1766165 RepID=A0ABV7L8K4_9PROT
MSEPGTQAQDLQVLLHDEAGAPLLWHWQLEDDRIGTESHAHAVAGPEGAVLIDPLPLAAAAMRQLEPVQAVCLTAACHQRSAWRWRERCGVAVHLPDGARPADEAPDRSYRSGRFLPGGLQAIATPGPDAAHHAFLWHGARKVLFCGDLLMRDGDGPLQRVPEAFHDRPEDSRRSLRHLLEQDFDMLCLAHGGPLTEAPKAALRRLLD